MSSEIFCKTCGAAGSLGDGNAHLPCGHADGFYLPLSKPDPLFPPLYQCSVCGKPVKITQRGEGQEPLKEWKCEHTTAPIWANRKVTLRGKGALDMMNPMQRGAIRLKLTVRQFLSALTGRSI